MSFKDIIKDSVLDSGFYDQSTAAQIAAALLAALVVGCLIYLVYRRFFSGVVFSKTFGLTLIGMTVLTAMVTLAISSNVVISLGMVGALSIVRFRTAIKDPLDLLYLFWAITSGITVGAGMYILCAVAAVIMILMIILFNAKTESGQVYILVARYSGDDAGDELIRALGRMKYYIKSKTLRKGRTEIAIEVFCRKNNVSFLEKIRDIPNVEDVTMIQYNGEYHG